MFSRSAFPAEPAAGSSLPVAFTSRELFSSRETLQRAAAVNQSLYAALESFVCNERIERYRGSGSGGASHIDTVTAKVSFENGAEHYSELQQKEHALPDISTLDGAWSEGEFGTLLKQTETLMRTERARLESRDEVNGTPALIYIFKVTAADSPWDLTVGGQHYLIPFQTRVWLSASSGEILKIVRSSTNVPAPLRIRQIDWSVTLSQFDLNGKTWLLPSAGEYQVLYRYSERREWNTLTFSQYHRYGSEAAIRFE